MLRACYKSTLHGLFIMCVAEVNAFLSFARDSCAAGVVPMYQELCSPVTDLLIPQGYRLGRAPSVRRMEAGGAYSRELNTERTCARVMDGRVARVLDRWLA